MYIVKTFGNMYISLNKLIEDQRAIFMSDSSDQRAIFYIYIIMAKNTYLLVQANIFGGLFDNLNCIGIITVITVFKGIF